MENKTTVLFGGEQITVTKRDGSSEVVTVRILPVKEFQNLLVNLDDEQRVAEIFCGKDEGWAETLSLESHEQIIEKGNAFNLDFFMRWVQRRVTQREKLAAGRISQPESPSPIGSASLPSKSA